MGPAHRGQPGGPPAVQQLRRGYQRVPRAAK